MWRWAGVGAVLGLMACGPQVHDRANVDVATLPMRCTGPLARTSQGTWVCSIDEAQIGVSRGADNFAAVGRP